MARFQDEFISTAPSTSPFNIAQPSSPYPPSESSSSPNIQIAKRRGRHPGTVNTCSVCGQKGHNRLYCPQVKSGKFSVKVNYKLKHSQTKSFNETPKKLAVERANEPRRLLDFATNPRASGTTKRTSERNAQRVTERIKTSSENLVANPSMPTTDILSRPITERPSTPTIYLVCKTESAIPRQCQVHNLRPAPIKTSPPLLPDIRTHHHHHRHHSRRDIKLEEVEDRLALVSSLETPKFDSQELPNRRSPLYSSEYDTPLSSDDDSIPNTQVSVSIPRFPFGVRPISNEFHEVPSKFIPTQMLPEIPKPEITPKQEITPRFENTPKLEVPMATISPVIPTPIRPADYHSDTDTEDEPMESADEIIEEMAEDSEEEEEVVTVRRPPRKKQKIIPKRVCNNCGEPGHYQKTCKKSRPFCDTCGDYGHESKNCTYSFQ